jgi:hypothetical protein
MFSKNLTLKSQSYVLRFFFIVFILKYKFVAKVKVVGTSLDQNLNGVSFKNTTSETIFSFGSFAVTSNFEGRVSIDYSNTLSSFVRPVTLETIGLTQTQSEIIHQYNTNAVLNLDRSDLNTFVRFGSAYEFLRISIQNIIVAYPGSLFMNSQLTRINTITFSNFVYNSVTNISTFKIPIASTVNTFGLAFNYGNVSNPDDNPLKNLNLSYNQYVVWSTLNPTGNSYTIIGFTGYTSNNPNLTVQTIGNPFPTITGATGGYSGAIDFHIKPNNIVFEEFRALLSDYEKYILSERITGNTSGFKFVLRDPILLDNGTISYSNTQMLWTTSDNYNIDVSTSKYRTFLSSILAIGNKYDAIKTDLIARFLTPDSIKAYDLTENGKMTKLLRIYGREFDQMKQFIDSLVNINHVTYDKVNNTPDQLIKNLSRTFGWNYFSLVNEAELVTSLLSISDAERNLRTDLMPAEIDIELWRRILINTNYFWKSKGTREALKSIFLLIGIPEPFINITEYVYTVDGKINPNSVPLTKADFPSNSLPYDTNGYPVAPLETSDFFFQVSGDTDAGQHYMDAFRMAGFNLMQNVDNRKSWIQAGATTRVDSTTPQYYQEDSKLVLNTKEVDVALDTARGIEYDVYDYIKNIDFPANSSGYTLPFSYVNISLGVSSVQKTFHLPAPYNKTEGNLEVRYNGILLNAPTTGNTGGTGTELTKADYSVSGNTFTLLTASAYSNSYRRDVIQATFIYSGNTRPVTGISVQYIVTRVDAKMGGTIIPLPSYPRGDVQVTVNGIALTKGTPQFTADYILDPANSTGGTHNIIIQNPAVISYLAVTPTIQVAYVQVTGSSQINARSEVVRVDSFNSGKVYYNVSANKYVYRLNYKANTASEIKVLIDGIALEPYTDYNINVQNQYEVFLPKGIKYGTIISVYYLVAVSSFFNPIVSDVFGVGDISKLSFLEFIELIQRKLINARNRKTITDFKGGWYPTLLNVYIQYLKRADLPLNDPLRSNGYTFENLYSFLSKYNSFFQRFVDELLPATIILKKSGLLVRNTIFTKQKFTYKRGVNIPLTGSTVLDIRKNYYNNVLLPYEVLLTYLGDDGSTFLIAQSTAAPPAAVVPTVITTALTNIIQTGATGGGNVTSDGGAAVTTRGIVWSTSPTPTTGNTKTMNGTGNGVFVSLLTGLIPNTTYYVRAYAINTVGIGYGNEISFATPAVVLIPSIKTTVATGTTQTAINNTGGYGITGYTGIDYYAMQYRVSGNTSWLLSPTLPLSGPLAINYFTTKITGLTSSITGGTYYQYRAYMVIAGTPYYGDIKLALTLSIPLSAATITTNTISVISITGATGGGNVTFIGLPALTVRGIVYGLAPNPTTGNTRIINGSTGTGSFTSSITELTPNTTYFVRAYATNSVGISYGSQVNFTTVALPNINLPIIQTFHTGVGPGQQSNGTIIPSPPLDAGQCITVNLLSCHVVFGVGSGQNLTSIYCSTNNGATWNFVSPTPFITNSPSSGPPNRCLCSNSLSVILYPNERLCYANQVSSTGLACTCSCLSISSVSSSPNITVTSSGSDTLLIAALVAPTVTTEVITSIGQNSATGGGNVTSEGTQPVIARGVVYDLSSNPTLANSFTTNGTGAGSFTSILTGLLANTTYFVRAYATNSVDITYGNQVTFTTLPFAPLVSTDSVYSITSNSAQGLGHIENNGGATVTAEGFMIGSNPSYINTNIPAVVTTPFNANLGTLVGSTTYYVKAYATNSVGTSYGGVISFTTPVPSPPVVTTVYALNIAMTTATIRAGIAYTGSHVINERGVVWATYQNPDETSNKQTNGTGAGNFDTAISGLVPNQLYYVRAYGNTIEDGHIYGNQICFTTS